SPKIGDDVSARAGRDHAAAAGSARAIPRGNRSAAPKSKWRRTTSAMSVHFRPSQIREFDGTRPSQKKRLTRAQLKRKRVGIVFQPSLPPTSLNTKVRGVFEETYAPTH